MCAAAVQMAMGMFGLVGFLMRYVSPLTIAVTVALVGISLYPSATDAAQAHWGIAILWVTQFNGTHYFLVASSLGFQSRHWAWLRRGYWRYRNLIDWLVATMHHCCLRFLLFSIYSLWSNCLIVVDITSNYILDSTYVCFPTSFRTFILYIIFAIVLGPIPIPLPAWTRERGCYRTTFPIFRLFPVSAKWWNIRNV